MATELDVERTLNYQLNSFVSSYNIDIAYTNVPYEPKEGTDYIKVDFLPATNVPAAIGLLSQNRIVGIYQFTINTNSDGKAKVKTIIDTLKTFFKRGTTIIYNGIKVRITKFAIGPYLDDAVWFQQVISVSFRSDIDN